MRRLSVLVSLTVAVLLGVLALHAQPVAIAQEATPTAEAMVGVTFQPVALATGLTLPATNELSIARIVLEPGAGFPIGAGDPTYALAVVQRGELTIIQDGPLVVTRAGALEAALEEAEAGGAYAPVTEDIAAGQEVTVEAGDTVLFPLNASGEIRNESRRERTIALVAFVGPPAAEATPTP